LKTSDVIGQSRLCSQFATTTYSPPPQSQRINDAVAEAQEAKQKLDAARSKIEDQLATDNSLRGELQALSEQNQRLQEQVDAAFAMKKSAPPASSSSPAAQAGSQAGSDPLLQWGQKVGAVTTQP
jgi:septal ring factor EnvC (AmiA/AmiB activator)